MAESLQLIGGEKTDMKEREILHHKTVRLAARSKQIKSVVFISNTALCV